MKQVLKDTLKTFTANWQILLLVASPVFIVNLLNFHSTIKLILSAVFLIASQLITYMYLLRSNEFYKLKSPKFVLKFIFIDMSLGAFLTILTYIGIYILLFNTILAILFIFFFILYFIARSNILLPMAIMEEDLVIKNTLKITSDTYLNWMIAATIIHIPLVAAMFLSEAETYQTLIKSLSIPLHCCFNTSFYLRKKSLS